MKSVLCLDIGSGTQDVLLYSPDMKICNCPKFILPSPAKLLAGRILRTMETNPAIYLYGSNMGGGFAGVVRKGLKNGTKFCCHPKAAAAFSDDLDKVRSMGIDIEEACPDGYAAMAIGDFEPAFWRSFLSQMDLAMPETVAIAAQDHGFHPGTSNRLGRFKLWEKFLTQAHGRPEALVYKTPPKELTRLRAIQECSGGGPVADTGSVALLGVLYEPEINKIAQEQGACVINIGNSHTIAFLVHQGRVLGIYEQHTGLIGTEKLWRDIREFKQGTLTNEQVFAERGHGCLNLNRDKNLEFERTYVIGPRRDMLKGYPVSFPAPGGDMMLAGCFGFLTAGLAGASC